LRIRAGNAIDVHRTRYKFGNHHQRSKSRRIAQKEIAIRPAQKVRAVESNATGDQIEELLRASERLTKPRALAARSTGANDQFHAKRIGLS
jgi:hypothetical protein